MREKRVIEDLIMRSQRVEKYDVGETFRSLSEKTGIKPSEILKLNSNENFFIPLDFVRGILRQVIEEIDPRIYPRDEFRDLRLTLSANLNIPAENIIIGTGSDQLIDLAARLFLREGDEALSISPTFAIYERCVKIQGASYRGVPLKSDFSLDVDTILSSTTPRTKIIFICSPNNPTANQFRREDIIRLAEEFDGLIAVDEAYADFAEATLIDAAVEFENLMVFRTFSKVFGLAGLRIGYAAAGGRLAKAINERFQMPYPVSLTALRAATKMMENMDYVRVFTSRLKSERSRLIDSLNHINGVKAFPSETNFVLFQVNRDSKAVYRALLSRGIIIREIGRILDFENCLRVTVAPSHMMARFIDGLKGALEDAGQQ